MKGEAQLREADPSTTVVSVIPVVVGTGQEALHPSAVTTAPTHDPVAVFTRGLLHFLLR